MLLGGEGHLRRLAAATPLAFDGWRGGLIARLAVVERLILRTGEVDQILGQLIDFTQLRTPWASRLELPAEHTMAMSFASWRISEFHAATERVEYSTSGVTREQKSVTV